MTRCASFGLMPMPTSPAVRVPVVEQILEAERAADRERVLLGEGAQVGAGALGPPAAADDDERPLCAGEHVAQPLEVRRPGRSLDFPVGIHVRRGGALGQDVFRQREHHRPLAAGGRAVESMAHVLRHPVGAVDRGDPLRHLPEHPAVVDLLERLALREVGPDLADEEDHRRRVLERGVDADRRIGRAGAARDEADPGLAGELLVALRHVRGAAVLARDDEPDRVARVVERVEHREITLAGNAERGVDAVDLEAVDENLGGGAGLQLVLHGVMNSSQNTW